ncbi:MAG: anthranilate synthase component II [Enterobacteriaceae bacterium]
MKKKLLIIDNYDSFTWNIYQYFCILGVNVFVVKNDKINIFGIKKFNPSWIVISPGPGNPKDSGISSDVVKYFYKKIPILGVCLGHQIIGNFFKAKIIRSKRVFHGKTSHILHDNNGVFKNLKNPLLVTRYHSLVISNKYVPDNLKVTSYVKDKYKEIMGIRHKKYFIEGVQFHPESILTENGIDLFHNFLRFRNK